MSHFIVISYDSPDGERLRREHLKEHLAYSETVIDRVAVGGPMRGEDGRTIGSMIVLTVASAGEARTILEGDPYYAAGVWAQSDIQPFRPVFGQWVGGKAW